MSTITATMGYRLVQAAKAHRARVAAGLSRLGLHVGQELVLDRLWREEGLIQSALADRLLVERNTLTKVLQGLERAGLIERRPDPEDARAMRVYLTDRGRSLRQPVEAVWADADRAMQVDFTTEERIVLRRLLEAARDNLT